jgi:glutamate synthase (NADPH/NADH) small chain
MNEANRCLLCKNRPCEEGCPVGVKIPAFIGEIQRGDPVSAYRIIREDNALPAICGRVCPQETQCEKFCVRGKKGEPVGIGRLERFAADAAMKENADTIAPTPKNGKAVAIVGSGPASLACAGELLQLGYGVTIFEALHEVGGVLSYGIPEFRLPKALVKREIDSLRNMGAEIVHNVVVGKTVTVDELISDMGYRAVFVGSGAGLPRFQGIEGESLGGVFSANEFLTRINLMKAYNFPDHSTPIRVGKSVCVIGGGNVAMDAARCAWARRAWMWSTGAVRRRCPRGWRRSTTQGKRA